MFLASACVFPPLLPAEPLPLQQADARLTREFDAPVDKVYSLILQFEFPSAAAIHGDEVVGTRYDSNCERDYAAIPLARRAGLGRPVPIHVLIHEKQTGRVVVDQVFDTLCQTSAGASTKTRTAARIALAAGRYTITVRNLASQAGLDGVKTRVSLVPGGGK